MLNMASYSTGGHLTIGGYATGKQESAGWISLGDTSLWDGNILSHSQEAFDNGAYIGGADGKETPDTYIPIVSFTAGGENINVGWYANLYPDATPEITQLGFALSTDGTPATAYKTTLWTPPLQMIEGEEYCYMYLYNGPNGKLNLGFGMHEVNEPPCTLADALTGIVEHGNLMATNYSLPITKSDGSDITEDDEEFSPDSSTPAWGEGNYDNDSDAIPVPNLPTLGAHNCGFLTVYNPSLSELQNFANFVWSRDVFDTIKKFIASPMELIVSLSVVPIEPIAGSQQTIKIGGISTEVGSTMIANQYMNVNCGTLNIREYFGSALDYGYTRISIFLPYIGVREIKADEVMGGAVNVQYNIDLVSGSCVAFISCFRQGLGAVLYSFEGNLATQIPIMSRDFSSIYTALARGVVDTALSGGSGVIGSGLQSAISVMSSRPTVSRAGNFSSNAGLLGIARPYVIIERPIQSDPKDSRKFYGRPSNITTTLGSLHGYTEVEEVFLDGLTCTDEERELVRQALEEGTIF